MNESRFKLRELWEHKVRYDRMIASATNFGENTRELQLEQDETLQEIAELDDLETRST